jgi:hypothetical protein
MERVREKEVAVVDIRSEALQREICTPGREAIRLPKD